MASDSVLDERTLRELYLTGFEIVVKEAKPKTIMSSYNLINGTYANENRHLLMDILRGEWGFDGAVVTDWGGSNDHALGVKNGSTLEMPAPGGDAVRELLAAVKSGKITEVDATQSRVEAGVMRNDLLQAEAELHNAFLSLGMMLGSATDTLYLPQGSLRLAERAFPAGMLVASALENRADLVAAMRNVDVAQRAVTVARRERNMDFDLALGVNHNGTVRNEIAPAPRFTGFTVGLSVPLKFSNFNKGTVEAARYREQQAQTAYEQARLQVQTEVMQNYRRYTSLIGQVRHYDNGLLENAASVVKGKIYSYDRGETSLLEVLNAQRTYDEVRTLYIETLYNYAASLVELETSAGIWDIAVE